MNVFARVINKLRKVVYEKYYRQKTVADYRDRIANTDFSIICNNCFGGMLSHDLGLKFLSPTINLYFDAEDYIKFLENLSFYLNCEIIDGGGSGKGNVIGLLNGEIKLHAIHYDTFDELKDKWNERKMRVNYDNLFVIGAYRDNCTDDLVRRFCALPFKNKVFLSHKEIDCENNDCIVKVKCGKNATEVPGADMMASCKSRVYDNAFDFIRWLNRAL